MQKVILLSLLALFGVNVIAQTPTATPAPAPSGIKANLAAGEVSAVNQPENKILLQTSDGTIEVVIAATTVFKRVPPETPTLAAAVASTFGEIGVNDKILVTGVVSADKKTIPAKAVYLMTKSDITKRNQAESELWRTRGISGKVVSIDFKTQEITISTPSRGMMPGNNVVLSPKENVEYLRYSSDSIKFSDAVDSSLAEIKVGDQLKALGDKSSDGLTFKAEKYITGSFRTLAGKIVAIDTVANEITIENPADKKPIIVVVKSDTVLKKFPTEQAQMMARMMVGGGMQSAPGGGPIVRPAQGNQSGGQDAPTGRNPNNANRQPQQTQDGRARPTGAEGQTAGGGQRQFGRGPGRATLEDILDTLPNLTVAELKIGDAIGISTAPGKVPNRFTAIKLVSGIEPFMTLPQINVGAGRGDQSPSFNIPGLDGGIGTP